MRIAGAFLPVTGFVLGLGGCRAQPRRAFIERVGADPRPAATTIAAVESTGALSEVTLRRVWPNFDAGFYAASISPDGRYLSKIDWSTGDLVVRDLKTGRLHSLTNAHNENGKPFEWAGVSVFSPDGSEIVVAWTYGSAVQLRVIDFVPDAAGVPHVNAGKVIFDNPEFFPDYPYDWSPDGSQVLARVYPHEGPAGGNLLALISTTDATYHVLRSFDWRAPLRAEFSPDGRFVAYDLPLEENPSNRDLFVLSIDGTYETKIVPHAGFDRLLAWLPDGSILFESERGGTPGVWRVPMAEGRPAGNAELVRADMWGIEPLGFGRRGWYYGVTVDRPRLYSGNVDLATGRLSSALDTIRDPSRGQIPGWEWSRDGRLLAYSANLPGVAGSLIRIRSAAGKLVQTIPLELGPAATIRWNPDGRSLILAARDAKGRRGFHRIDLETGASRPILVTDGLDEPTWRSNFALSADGGTLYFTRAREFGQPGTLVAYDIASGTDRVLLPSAAEIYGHVTTSPDGARLAFVTRHASAHPSVVSTVPVTGGRATSVAELPPSLVYIWGVEWTPDGQSILVVASEKVDLTRQLWIVPAAGGTARKIELTDPTGRHPHLFTNVTSPVRLHPDGRRVAFMAGGLRGEVWLMTGLETRDASSSTGGAQ